MSSTSEIRDASSSLYHIELLKEDNWLPWKRRVTGVLRERRLLKYVDGSSTKPELSPGADATVQTAYVREYTSQVPRLPRKCGHS